MKKALLILSLLFILPSCTTPATSSGAGILFTDAKEGLFIDNNVKASKTGEACESSILGIITSGDSSVETAKNNGNIKNVSTMNRTYFGVLGVYGKSCLIIQGN